jgi:4-amino-4-deoxy-L-arabinose transferase-like glycosyltransferase
MNPDRVFPLLVFVLALAARMSVLDQTGFDGLYGQDAYAYHAFAGSLRAVTAHGGALPPFFWPLGYPALLALVGAGAQAGQIANILLGALICPVVYAITRLAGARPAAALVAALIPALGGQAIQSSIVLMSDVPALLWASASGAALLWAISRRRARWLYASGLLLMLAIVTRYQYAALLVPWGLALLLARIGLRHLVCAGLLALPIAALQAAYSAATPYPTLNHPWVTGWSPAHVFARSFDTPDGHFDYTQPNALYYAQPAYSSPYLVPGLGLFAAMGVWKLRRRGIFLALIGGWVLVPYGFLAGIPYQNIRFALIMLPGTAALAGVGVDRAWSALRALPTGLRALLLAGVCGWALAQVAADGLAYARAFIARQQADKAVIVWAGDILPPGATVYTQGLVLALQAYTTVEAVEIYNETPQTLAVRTAHPDDFLLVNLWQIEHQWVGRSPQLAVRWLGENRGLTAIGRFGVYTLYRIAGAEG